MLPVDDARIEVLSAELADQIAAGEVVERPASVVKELVENAIDAGASRVEVQLEKAGLEKIVVRDDGRGIHADDLALSVTRHATSKLRSPSDLVEVRTLGFRGEALASIAAVANVTVESRPAQASGLRMRCRPGLSPETEPVGIAPGTRIEVGRLFANVPARRKFMRAEATEVGHCSDTMLRLALANPGVHLRLRHGNRELLDLPAADLQGRIAQVLSRRTSLDLIEVDGVHEGVEVGVTLAPPAAAVRGGGGLYIIVRRRVVRERALSRAVSAAFEGLLPAGRSPLGCLRIEPPTGSVDVNVHPQKAEVRFADPQSVYAAARRVLEDARVHIQRGSTSAPTQDQSGTEAVAAADRGVRRFEASTPTPTLAPQNKTPAQPRQGGYSLRTAATRAEPDYLAHRREVDATASALRRPIAEPKGASAADAPRPTAPVDSGPPLALLTCLPGPVALLRYGDELLSVDMRALRSHLVYRRLADDLGSGTIAAQGLLSPVVVARSAADVGLCARNEEALAGLGLVVEAFGDDAVMVRAVPAGLRHCVEEPDLEDLIDRVIAWLRVHDAADSRRGLQVVADTRGADPAPRLARRWVRELLDANVDLASTPGIRVFTVEALRE